MVGLVFTMLLITIALSAAVALLAVIISYYMGFVAETQELVGAIAGVITFALGLIITVIVAIMDSKREKRAALNKKKEELKFQKDKSEMMMLYRKSSAVDEISEKIANHFIRKLDRISSPIQRQTLEDNFWIVVSQKGIVFESEMIDFFKDRYEYLTDDVQVSAFTSVLTEKVIEKMKSEHKRAIFVSEEYFQKDSHECKVYIEYVEDNPDYIEQKKW